MGSLLNRSSSVRPEGTKSKWRKGKGKRSQKIETSTEADQFVVQNDNEHRNSNENLIHPYEEWNKRIDQQQISNIHGDPPGAPSTYSINFPMIQNDPMTQSWSPNHDANNQFYQNNSFPMTTTSNIPYDPNQYIHTKIPNTFMNQPQPVILDERSSKKVQFARPIEQQTPSKIPLTNTQSWHELSVTNNDISVSTTKQEPVLTRQSVHRSVMPKTNTLLAQVPVQKPIYVGIDHRATLAERGQTTANKRHHKNNEKNNFDITNNHRTHSHTQHQHKHQELNDFSTSKNNIPSNKSVESSQIKLPSTHRSLTTTSTSTITPNKLIQHTEQPIFNNNEIKISRTRGQRQSQAQQTEQPNFIDNDTKQSNRGNHSQHRQQEHHQQQRTTVNRNNSPLRTDRVRRVENKQQNTSPVMRTPISQSQQQRQKQSTMPSTANITRTRV